MRIPAVSASEIDKNTIGGGYWMGRSALPVTAVYVTDFVAVSNTSNSAVDSTGALIIVDNSVYVSGEVQPVYVLKYDSAGSLIWQKKLTANNGDGLYGISLVVDSSDNIYVSSYRSGSSGVQTYVSKLNSSGTFISETRIYNPSWTNSSQFGLSIDSSNNIYLTGRSYGGATQNWNACTTKLNSSLVIQWTKEQYTNSSVVEYAQCSVVDSSGNVYVVGQSDAASTTAKLTIVKYNSSGTVSWSRIIDSGGEINPRPLLLDSSNNLYIPVSYTTTPGGSSNSAIIKYNSSGVLQWSKSLLYNGSAITSGLWGGAKDSSDNLYFPVGAQASSFTGGFPYGNILAMDSSGNIITGGRYNKVTNMNPGSPANPFSLYNSNLRSLNIVGTSLYTAGFNLLQTVSGVAQNSNVWVSKLPLNDSKYGLYAIPNKYSFEYNSTSTYSTTNAGFTDNAWSILTQNANLSTLTTTDITYSTGTFTHEVVT